MHEQIRIGHDAGRVELEGIEDEGSSKEVVADHHPALAETALGYERVGRSEIASRHLMDRDTGAIVPSQR